MFSFTHHTAHVVCVFISTIHFFSWDFFFVHDLFLTPFLTWFFDVQPRIISHDSFIGTCDFSLLTLISCIIHVHMIPYYIWFVHFHVILLMIIFTWFFWHDSFFFRTWFFWHDWFIFTWFFWHDSFIFTWFF